MAALTDPSQLEGWQINKAPGASKTLLGAWCEVLKAIQEGRPDHARRILQWQPEPGQAFVDLLSVALYDLHRELADAPSPAEPRRGMRVAPSTEASRRDLEAYRQSEADAQRARLAAECATCHHLGSYHREDGFMFCVVEGCGCPTFRPASSELPTLAEAPQPTERVRVICVACAGGGWSRSASGRCSSCRGAGGRPGTPEEAEDARRRLHEQQERERELLEESRLRAEKRKAEAEAKREAKLAAKAEAEWNELGEQFDVALDKLSVKPRPVGPPAWPWRSREEEVRDFLLHAQHHGRESQPRHDPKNGDPACVVCLGPCVSKRADADAPACRRKKTGSSKRSHSECYRAAMDYAQAAGWELA